MSYGLTPEGFVGKPAAQSKSDFEAQFKAAFGQSIGSEPDGSIPAASSIGQEIAILADAESALWEALQAVHGSGDPDQAIDAALDALCALTGTRRKLSVASTVRALLWGTAGTQLQPDRVLTVSVTGERFDLLASSTDPNAPNTTLVAVTTAWANAIGYAVGDLVKANGNTYVCVVAGTSAVAGGGPAATGTGAPGSPTNSIPDATVTWGYLGPDTVGVAYGDFEAEQTGPIGVAVGELSNIATPVSGWTNAHNLQSTSSAPNALGRSLETDAALRGRRQAELQGSGGGPADAIRAAILEIEEVQECRVFVNSGDVVDADGVPAHGVEVLIRAPSAAPTDNASLAKAVWQAVGAGVATGGNLGSLAVTDASGNVQQVRFSRPVEVPILVQATVYYDPAKWPAVNPGAAVIAAAKSALLTFAEEYYQVAYDVRVLALAAAVRDGRQATELVAGVPTPVVPAPAGAAPAPGIVDVDLQTKKAGGVFSYNPITIALREIATFDAADLTLTATALVP